jgi:hypothetical protein
LSDAAGRRHHIARSHDVEEFEVLLAVHHARVVDAQGRVTQRITERPNRRQGFMTSSRPGLSPRSESCSTYPTICPQEKASTCFPKGNRRNPNWPRPSGHGRVRFTWNEAPWIGIRSLWWRVT